MPEGRYQAQWFHAVFEGESQGTRVFWDVCRILGFKLATQLWHLREVYKREFRSQNFRISGVKCLPGGKGYRFRYLILHPDTESLRGAEESMIYVYMERTPEDTTFHKLRAAVIPRTDRAKEVIGKWARGKKRQKTESAERSVLLEQGHTQSSDCFTETEYTTFCTIGTIDDPPLCFPVETEVVVCGESGSGDPLDPPPGPGTGDPSEGDDPCPDPWSCDDGSGSGNDNDNNDPSPGDDNCGEGSLPGTDDGQCVDEPDDPFEDPEPCETGDEILDDPNVHGEFQNLWDSTNFGDEISPNPLDQRLETAAWIIQTSTGFEALPLDENFIERQDACGIDYNGPVPENVVGLIHTHPYTVGTDLTSICELNPDNDDPIYRGEPSKADFKQGVNNGITFGENFQNYIMDADGISSYNLLQSITETQSRHEPCGFEL